MVFTLMYMCKALPKGQRVWRQKEKVAESVSGLGDIKAEPVLVSSSFTCSILSHSVFLGLLAILEHTQKGCLFTEALALRLSSGEDPFPSDLSVAGHFFSPRAYLVQMSFPQGGLLNLTLLLVSS